jgi:DNA-directed RNA polymerase specialized sigma24 family protein
LNVSRFAAGTRVVDGLGKSAEDFAVDTLILFWEGKLEFSGDERGLYGYLAEVMGNDILDALRSKARTTTKKVAPVSGEKDQNDSVLLSLDDFDSGLIIQRMVEGDIFKQKLYGLLETEEPELSSSCSRSSKRTPILQGNRGGDRHNTCRRPQSEKTV